MPIQTHSVNIPKYLVRLGIMIILFVLKSSADLVQASTTFASTQISYFVELSKTQRIRYHLKSTIHKILPTLLKESDRFNLDPLLVLSIIQVESGFSVKKHGRHGEIGLMQIKPSTARWIAKRNKIPWHGAKSLENPATNIRLGTAYLAYLRYEFNSRQQLYLSAYNMGTNNVRRAIRRQIMPKEYSSRVLQHYQNSYSSI